MFSSSQNELGKRMLCNPTVQYLQTAFSVTHALFSATLLPCALIPAISKYNNTVYYSFKIFLHFWLAKSTCIIHHNQPLLTKFGRILQLINRWRQKCNTVAGYCTVNREEVGTRLNCFGCEKKNGLTVGGTFYSFHDELLSKNIARRQLDGHLLFGVYLQTWRALYLLNMHYRGELNINEGKHVLACF